MNGSPATTVRRPSLRLATIAAAAIWLAACGGGGDPAPGPGRAGDVDLGDLGELVDRDGNIDLGNVGELLEGVGSVDLGNIDFNDPAAGEELSERLIDSFTTAGSRAVVTIGGERYEATGLHCVAMFGAVAGSTLGDVGVDIEIETPPANWQTSGDDGWSPPRVVVRGENLEFRAGGALEGVVDVLPPGADEAIEFHADGGRVTGTATFFDVHAYTMTFPRSEDMLEPIPGTFELDCSGQ